MLKLYKRVWVQRKVSASWSKSHTACDCAFICRSAVTPVLPGLINFRIVSENSNSNQREFGGEEKTDTLLGLHNVVCFLSDCDPGYVLEINSIPLLCSVAI